MTQELDNKIRLLRAEMTRMVHEGNDEDGTLLRRMLAELERLENQRMMLRGYHDRYESRGGAPAGLAIVTDRLPRRSVVYLEQHPHHTSP